MTNDIGKDRERINFESHYYADLKEELLMIQNFKVPQELLDAFDQPDLLDCFEPNKEGKTKENYEIKAIIIGRKEGENYFFACQKFTPKKMVMKKKGIYLLYDRNTFVTEEPKFSINIEEKIDCIFTEGNLIFEKYNEAKGVFELDDYYRIASQKEVQDFVRSNVFRIDNDKLFYKHTSSVFMRKKIAKIIDLGTLNDTEKIYKNARVVNMDIEFTEDGKQIIMPVEYKKLRKVMSFLAEEIYSGQFTNYTYLTNSTRKI